MSSIAERARAEADEAEREDEEHEGVTETEPETEPDAEPEQTPDAEPVTEARIKKIGKAIEGEDTRHEKRLREIYGDLFGEREPCPLCLQEGFIIPAQADQFDPMQRMAVLGAMGELAAPKLNEHPKIHRCSECDGLGFLATGSRRDGFTEKPCFKCDGNGFVDEDVEAAMRAIAPLNTGYVPPVAPVGPAVVNSDQWGRPLGSERWGQDPAQNGGLW